MAKKITIPLSIPFSGNKKNRYKEVRDIVIAGGYDTVLEPFGGSGVLSVNLKLEGLVKRAIVNDYDNLFVDYPIALKYREDLIRRCERAGFKKDDREKLPDHQIKQLQEWVRKIPPKYYNYISVNFVFSGRRASGSIEPQDFRYFMKGSDMTEARMFFKAAGSLELDHLDYRDFFAKHNKDLHRKKSLWIIDPPYLNSAQKQYENGQFFGMAESIELIQLILAGSSDVILFNQVKKDWEAILDFAGVKNYTILTKLSAPGTGQLAKTRMGGSTGVKGYREDVLIYIRNSDRGRP